MMVDGYRAFVPRADIAVDAIFSVHYYEYASNFSYPGESHNFWEFCYVDKGEVLIPMQEQEFLLKKGEILFIEPNVFHALLANGKVAPNLVVASFSTQSPMMEWFRGKKIAVGDTERTLMARMISEAAGALESPLDDPHLKELQRTEHVPIGSEQIFKNCIEWMLIELYRAGHASEAVDVKPTSLIKSRSQQELLSRVIEYMENNIDKKLTLETICRDNLVGRSHLQKNFREKTGGGAMEYFGKMKIEAAKQMIREGHFNFTEVAAKLGYNSIHYFSRHFKKATGMTPSEYASSVKVLTASAKGNGA